MKGIYGQTKYPAHLLQKLVQEHLLGYESDSDRGTFRLVPEFCVELPRVLVTPCRESVTGFELEMSNRVIRKFVQTHHFQPESFVRVTLGDENGDKLFPGELQDWRQTGILHDNNGPVAVKIRAVLLNGLLLNGKNYRFLAYSSSQLKEASVWMVCPKPGWTIDRMRDLMGDFSMCKTPSKYAARIGQCFSTTVAALPTGKSGANKRQVLVNDRCPDIESFHMGTMQCHSDGEGLIKKELLEQIVINLPFDIRSPSDVSTIQIRYGGAKGVLTAWDFDALNKLECQGYDICLRPSMIKFTAPYDQLEVVRVGKDVPYYLNRHVILLLASRGIDHDVFLGMQTDMFQSLNKMLTESSEAAKMIPFLVGPDGGLCSTLMSMLSIGLSPKHDPFLFSCLHALRTHHLMNLRKKSRIFVEKGAVLIGGIDEMGIIPEGCVFVQVPMSRSNGDSGIEENDGFVPIVGQIMVTKHPVMHPGDVRMLVGIDLPQFRNHRNVILFSQRGTRPEANKMSGSDLDGDEFAVTWDERLFFGGNVNPMDYSPPSQQVQESEIGDEGLIDHFINHARTANLGQIANLWLDHAAINKAADCDDCLALAKLFSVAVDFPKSGIPAIIPPELKLNQSVPRAHWREKKDSDTFVCNSAVGKLYDQVIREVKDTKKAESPALAGRRTDKNGRILIYGDGFDIVRWKSDIVDAEI